MSEKEGLYYTQGRELPETPPPGAAPAPWRATNVVGQPLPRVDAYERVSGTALYPSDTVLPRMLYGAILRCPHPNAIVKKVDTRAARQMPGVFAVISGDDPDADVDWKEGRGPRAGTKIFDPRCRYEGDAVAAVAAETPYLAQDALRAITVEYQTLPAVSDDRDALKDGAPAIYDGGNRVTDPAVYQRGDVAKGFAEAEAVVEQDYRTESELHTPLEPHGCVANWDGKNLTIWESTQGVFNVQSGVAETLGLPLSRVRVIGHYVGGGFGSKLGPGKHSVIAALLAAKSGRPVKLFLSREETLLCAGNRPPGSTRVKLGAKKDGTLTAIQMTGTFTGGAYATGGSGLVDWLARDLYLCPNVRTEMTDVYINAGPSCACRAPGHPQGAWALEQAMDALAEKLGMDPVALRLANAPSASQARGDAPYTSTGLRRCLEEGARAFGWEKARRGGPGEGRLRRGVGVAAGEWIGGAGGPPSTVIVKMLADGSVNLNMGASDIGTGTKTVMAMVVAEELGVRPESIQIENADTGTTQFATASGGSKTVPTEAPTTRAAAIEVKRQLLQIAADELGASAAELSYEGERIVSRKEPSKKIKVTDLKGLRRRGLVVGVGTRAPNPEGVVTCPFAAQFCEVEVDTGTGELRVVRFLGAHESGRVMDLMTFGNQVRGGITWGVTFGTTAERILDRGQTGKLLSKSWHDYKLATALDAPREIVPLPIEPGDTQCNSVGAKGLGEPVAIPTAAAIANAVYHAVGVRVAEGPITPAKIVAALAARGAGQPAAPGARKEG